MSDYERLRLGVDKNCPFNGIAMLKCEDGEYIRFDDVEHLIKAEARRDEAAKIVRDAEEVYRGENESGGG